jgi:cbb3-type cytochrome oxidase cytochrome c subunit
LLIAMRRFLAPTLPTLGSVCSLSRSFTWLPLVLLACLAAPLAAQDDEEDEDDPGLPGLMATHAQLLSTGRDGLTVVDTAPQRLALSLGSDESPHPAIPAGRFRTIYMGRLFVQRAGKYTFRVETTGGFQLDVGPHQAFNNVGPEGSERPAAPTTVELKYGFVPLVATYTKREPSDAAELRVFWQREGEAEFALPIGVLSRERPKAAAKGMPPAAAEPTFEQGRRLVADHRCAACHEVAGLSSAAGTAPVPRAALLPGIGDRISEAWIQRWLANPKAVRRLATMPDLFGDTPEEQADLYAATKYLGSLKDKKKVVAKPAAEVERPDAAAVRKSMASVGCVACHTLPGEDATKFPDLRPLTNLGDKTTASVLEKRIAEPRAYHPSSRMPDFELDKEQPKLLRDIAAYLADQHAPEALPTPKAPAGDVLEQRWNTLFADDSVRGKFEQMPEDERWRVLGSRVVETRGCLNCHDLDKRTTRLKAPSLVGIGDAKVGLGCLNAAPQAPAASYSFDDGQRVAVAKALQLPAKQKPAKAPLYLAQRQLHQNQCTSCHNSGGGEGAFAKRILSFVPLGTDQTLHDLAPPNLAGIGEKLTAKTMQSVIDGKTRARPWMALRMPHFGEETIKGLGTGLAALDGIGPDADADEANLAATVSDEDIEIGRQLVGRTGLNCVSCHDIRGIPSIGVRGPDLARVPGRVRQEWFRNWLLDPQRFAPGTRMPTVFFGGKSAAPQYLDGDPERQIAALWAYLSQGSKMELPSLAPPANAIVPGGENPRFTPTDRPLIARGFMPGVAGLRGVAIGTPEKTHFAFDSERCVLSAAWTGDFAEIGGWFDNGRGTPEDNALKPLGKIVWRAPADIPTIVADGAQSASDAPPLATRFRSAWAEKNDAGFAYRLEVEPGKWLDVEEHLQPTPKGFRRKFVLRTDVELPTLRMTLADLEWTGIVITPKALGPARKVGTIVVPPFPLGESREIVVDYDFPTAGRQAKSEVKTEETK